MKRYRIGKQDARREWLYIRAIAWEWNPDSRAMDKPCPIHALRASEARLYGKREAEDLCQRLGGGFRPIAAR